MIFQNRKHAGILLSEKLLEYKSKLDVLILALPRGGVPVAFEIAKALKVPMDVFIVRKLGYPGQPELAMGAIGSGGVVVINESVVAGLGIDRGTIEMVKEEEEEELKRRELQYRKDRALPSLKGKIIILVDDGLATGATMKAAVKSVRALGAGKVVVAVPVAPPDTFEDLKKIADEVVCLETPWDFSAVGEWYRDFTQTTDNEVINLLEQSRNIIENHQID